MTGAGAAGKAWRLAPLYNHLLIGCCFELDMVTDSRILPLGRIRATGAGLSVCLSRNFQAATSRLVESRFLLTPTTAPSENLEYDVILGSGLLCGINWVRGRHIAEKSRAACLLYPCMAWWGSETCHRRIKYNLFACLCMFHSSSSREEHISIITQKGPTALGLPCFVKRIKNIQNRTFRLPSSMSPKAEKEQVLPDR